MFVKITTNAGLIGYSECSDSFGSNKAIAAAVKDLAKHVEGRDPGAYEAIYWDLYRISRQSWSGVVQKAIAGIENALLDIKGKTLGVPVYELFGGPTRDKLPVYWSHCASTRIRSAEHVNQKPVRTYEDIRELAAELKERGYRSLKSNLVLMDEGPVVVMQGYRGPLGSSQLTTDSSMLRQIDKYVEVWRDAVGPDVDIMIDLNSHFRCDGNQKVAKILEPYNLYWLEVDSIDPHTLRELKDRVSMPIASCENVGTARGYRPYLEARSQHVAVIDVLWNGFAQSKKIADMAETFDMNIAPHNHYSHLATLMSAHFCMAISNAQILEVDVDDVPWRETLLTNPPVIEDGFLTVPDGPGWGADIREEVLGAHPWDI